MLILFIIWLIISMIIYIMILLLNTNTRNTLKYNFMCRIQNLYKTKLLIENVLKKHDYLIRAIISNEFIQQLCYQNRYFNKVLYYCKILYELWNSYKKGKKG